MRKGQSWEAIPLTSVILQAVRSRGVITESDLLKKVNRSLGLVSPKEFNKALMTLENQALIHVSWLKKGTERRMQEVKGKSHFVTIGED